MRSDELEKAIGESRDASGSSQLSEMTGEKEGTFYEEEVAIRKGNID